jgi:hypothetical protein
LQNGGASALRHFMSLGRGMGTRVSVYVICMDGDWESNCGVVFVSVCCVQRAGEVERERGWIETGWSHDALEGIFADGCLPDKRHYDQWRVD